MDRLKLAIGPGTEPGPGPPRDPAFRSGEGREPETDTNSKIVVGGDAL